MYTNVKIWSLSYASVSDDDDLYVEIVGLYDSLDKAGRAMKEFVANAIRESATIETEYVMFRQEIKTDSKIIKAFCSNFLDMGFTTDPSEVFWVICINPLLPKEKRFHTRFSWEDDLNE